MSIAEQNRIQIQTMRENFKSLREQRDWSIEKLSRVSGIKEKILIAIETDQNFELKYLFTLCRLYNIKPHEIFLPLAK
ncbi:MAG: helix-turn-helix domain-containing protein [Oscillospiraceae bacterium]|nr:helix-turn-helix domain-containing protein [Oscillospiraceae bacterium]